MNKLIKNIMAAGGSKPLVEPPRDWDKQQGGTKSFEVISPCSDISNPSDFNRVRYNKNSRQYQLTHTNGGDYNPHELPVAVKSRRSHSTGGHSDGDIVAPGAFYFPTKESERRAENLAKKESQKNDGKIVFKRTNGHPIQSSRSKKGNMKAFRSLARKTAKKMKKKRDAFQRVALALGHACLEETRNKITLVDKDNQLERRKPSASLRNRRRSEQIERGVLQSSTNRRDVPLNKFKNDQMIVRAKSSENMERHENQMNQVASAALHQADAYFDRLSLSATENHGASPFVRRGGADNRITSILESTSKTPQNRIRRPELDSPIDTPVSDLFSASDSLPNMRDNEHLASKNNNSSPVSSLMLFYSKSGPLETTPKSYCSEGDSIEERRHKIIAKASRESESNSLYTYESKSHKKTNGKKLKRLAHRNLQKDSYGLNSNVQAQTKLVKSRKNNKAEAQQKKQDVSKLESLFRPILPALSTDDARSECSYDPYEIKVTESAPGAMQAVAIGFRRKNSRSEDSSASSTRSQQKHSSSSKDLLSNQARNNAEFLFTNDYGPVVIDGRKVDRDDTSVSISTTSSRSRVGHKYTQKGASNSANHNDDISYSSRSTRSERRVRFSEGSSRTRLRNKRGDILDTKDHPFDEAEKFPEKIDERDEENEEEEEVPQERVVKEQSPVNKFEPSVKRVLSVDESIDRPQIETKISNMTDNESPRSIQSDERTAVTISSVHWTKTQTGVTPYVRGKTTAEPTKSPLYRYRDAKTKFNSQKSADEPRLSPRKTKSPKKSPKRSPSKSPAKMMRKGSGGLVSTRINELNTRVSEVRKLNRMRKKNMNPRLHTHNFDNTQPVRSRALINYKTDSANLGKRNDMMAAKFNVIPFHDDDETTVYSRAHTNSRNMIEDDDVSKMSEITGATFGTVRTVRQQRESVATVKQQRDSMGTVRQQRSALAAIHQQRGLAMNKQLDSGDSTTSRTTASSGFRNVKKQMFRNSDAENTIKSESTSLSMMMYKENTASPKKTTFAPPVTGTPAMKWRTLAAAAAEKDALKMSATKPKKALGLRDMNVNSQYAIYGFKD